MGELFKKILSSSMQGLLGEIRNVLDTVITTDAERLAATERINALVMQQLGELANLQAQVLRTELGGNWLQRSWRPILMLSFGFVILYAKFLAPAFSLPNTQLEPAFWDLLELGVGGYVIGRTVEKVADRTVDSVSKSFLRRKERDPK